MFTRKTDNDSPKKETAPTSKEVEKAPAAPERTSSPAPTPLKPTKSLGGSSQMVPSIIGDDLTVEGNLISKGEVQLEGEVKGDIQCTSLVIGDKALVEGGVIAEDVIIRGRVVGSVRGHRVTLQSSSHVDGDIFHQSLAIEQGAYFEGKSRRADDPIAEAKISKSPSKSTSASSPSPDSGSPSNSPAPSGSKNAAE